MKEKIACPGKQVSHSHWVRISPKEQPFPRSSKKTFASQPLHLSDYYPIPDLYPDLLARLKGEGEGEGE